jgi:neurofibromin 1
MQEDDETPALTSVIPPQFLPDEMRVLQNPAKLVETFVKDLTNLLVVDHMQLREVARDALGCELSPRLHSRLLKHLDEYGYMF